MPQIALFVQKDKSKWPLLPPNKDRNPRSLSSSRDYKRFSSSSGCINSLLSRIQSVTRSGFYTVVNSRSGHRT